MGDQCNAHVLTKRQDPFLAPIAEIQFIQSRRAIEAMRADCQFAIRQRAPARIAMDWIRCHAINVCAQRLQGYRARVRLPSRSRIRQAWNSSSVKRIPPVDPQRPVPCMESLAMCKCSRGTRGRRARPNCALWNPMFRRIGEDQRSRLSFNPFKSANPKIPKIAPAMKHTIGKAHSITWPIGAVFLLARHPLARPRQRQRPRSRQ